MKRKIVTWAAVATIGSAAAQSGASAGGLLMDKDVLMPADMVSLSQTQFNFGSARVMAMAGAFTSLGADVSSMSINPAGLGMYRKSEISLTPMMTFGHGTTDAAPYGKNSTGRFSMANTSVAIKVYEGTRKLMGVTIGVGYNRIADFNYDSSFQRQNQQATVADVFARQMVRSGFSKNGFYDYGGAGDWDWDLIPVDLWNSALAYRAFMIDQIDPDNPATWRPTWIGNDAAIGHYTTVKSRGSAGEYDVSVGLNVENKFYFGATIGIQSLRRRLYIDYAEDYRYADPSGAVPEYGLDPSLDYQLLYAKLNQAVTVSGIGANLKLGIIYRPVVGLRLGVAFHTRTYYSLDREFQSSAAGMAYANRDTDPNVRPVDGYISSGTIDMTTPLLVDENPYNWSFVAPARLLFGASYAFGARAVVSVDYERDWYNGIRLRNNPSEVATGIYNDTFRQHFKGSNIVRIGAEFKAAPWLALRAGVGYSGSMLRDSNTIPASPIIKRTTYCSAGLGWTLSRTVTLDLAYQYAVRKTTDYYLFYVEEGSDHAESSLYSTKFTQHNVALTLGFRF